MYGLNSHKRPPPVGDHLSLTFWVAAYGMFDCIHIDGVQGFDEWSYAIL